MKAIVTAPATGQTESVEDQVLSYRRPRRAASVEAQLVVGLAILCAYFALRYPDQFVSTTNLTNMTRVAGILLVVAVGQMLALVVGGFDISVGANMGFVSTVAALGMTEYGGGIGFGIALGLLAGTAVGFVNGVLIARLSVSPFVVTLGMLTFLTGLSNHLSGGASVPSLPRGFRTFGANDWGPVPSSMVIAAAVVAVVWLVLSHTRVGLYIYSIGGSRETARLSGVRVVRYEILAYAMCGSLVAVGGILLSSRVGVGQASLGLGFDLLSIATAVIGGVAVGGGVGRLRGVALGVALLTVLTTGLDIAGTGQFIQQMITGAVLVGSVLLAQARGVRLLAVFDNRKRPTLHQIEP